MLILKSDFHEHFLKYLIPYFGLEGAEKIEQRYFSTQRTLEARFNKQEHPYSCSVAGTDQFFLTVNEREGIYMRGREFSLECTPLRCKANFASNDMVYLMFVKYMIPFLTLESRKKFTVLSLMSQHAIGAELKYRWHMEYRHHDKVFTCDVRAEYNSRLVEPQL